MNHFNPASTAASLCELPPPVATSWLRIAALARPPSPPAVPPIAPTVASMSAGAAVSVPKSESSTAIGAASTSSAVLTTWTLSTGTTSVITTSSVVGSTTGMSSGSEASKSSKASRVSGAPDTITRAFSCSGGCVTTSAIERSTMTWTRRLTAHAGAFFSSPPSRAAADWAAGAAVKIESSGAASVAMEFTRCRSSQFCWGRSAPAPPQVLIIVGGAEAAKGAVKACWAGLDGSAGGRMPARLRYRVFRPPVPVVPKGAAGIAAAGFRPPARCR